MSATFDASGLRVAIDSRMTPQSYGGVAHAAKGLIQGLSQLEDGSERYVVFVDADDQRAWIEPHLGANQTLVDLRVRAPVPPGPPQPRRSLLNRATTDVKHSVKAMARRIVRPDPPAFVRPEVEVSNGYLERLECHVMHFPSQRFTLCAVPSVYNPHDLQHLHYPQFFGVEEIVRRELVYRTGCQIARCVMVGSEWIKNDVVSSYAIDARRVQVIPEGAPTQFTKRPDDAALASVRAKFALTVPFAMYPATTWEHKNHIRLLQAVRLLRDQSGLTVNVVCPGPRHEAFWPEIETCIETLQLQSQVRFLGFVSEAELAAVYGLADALILPSLFEASSLPIFEAWYAGIPVASSNATALPEQVVDAALLFDPLDVDAIAQSLRQILTDQSLRASLVARGSARLKDFDWLQAAKGYRAVYRRAAGRPLTDEDRWLLSWGSMRDAGTRRPDGFVAQTAGRGTPS
jgi:glycosyltransferase involved in cell wall biosynthesis